MIHLKNLESLSINLPSASTQYLNFSCLPNLNEVMVTVNFTDPQKILNHLCLSDKGLDKFILKLKADRFYDMRSFLVDGSCNKTKLKCLVIETDNLEHKTTIFEGIEKLYSFKRTWELVDKGTSFQLKNQLTYKNSKSFIKFNCKRLVVSYE